MIYRLFFLYWILGGWLCALPMLAHGHAQLVTAVPPPQAVVPVAPTEVRLQFNEPIALLEVRWVFSDGTLRVLEAMEAEVQGASLVISVPSDAPAGTQGVGWRVVSADGHPVGGLYVFSIGTPSAEPAWQEASIPALQGPAIAVFVARLALTLTLALGVGGMLWARLAGHSPGPLTHIAFWGIFPAALWILVAQGMDLADAWTHPGTWKDWPSYMRSALDSPYGTAAGLALLSGACLWVWRGRWGGILAWLLAAGSFASAGHAAKASPVAWMSSMVWLHAATMIFWAGALAELTWQMRTTRQVPSQAYELQRFSRWALPMVVVLVLSGVFLTIQQMGGRTAVTQAPFTVMEYVWASEYGKILAIKLFLVLGAGGLALLNRYWWMPRLQTGSEQVRRRLLATIRLEFLLILLILVLTAGFRLTPPPRAWVQADMYPSSALPNPETESVLYVHLHGRTLMADVAFHPGRSGWNRIEIELMGIDQDFQQPLEMELLLTHPETGMGPWVLPALFQPHTHRWHTEPVHLPIKGTWEVRLDVLLNPFRKESILHEVLLPP